MTHQVVLVDRVTCGLYQNHDFKDATAYRDRCATQPEFPPREINLPPGRRTPALGAAQARRTLDPLGGSQNFSALLQRMTRLASVHLFAENSTKPADHTKGSSPVTTITTTDGTELFHKY
jgi:hypothetical protein